MTQAATKARSRGFATPPTVGRATGRDLVTLARGLEGAISVAQMLDMIAERQRAGKGVSRPHSFSKAKLRYEHPDGNDDPQPDKHAHADVELARRIGEVIQLHYPGHPWAIEVEGRNGIAKVGIPMLMGYTSWFIIHLDYLKSDPSMKIVVKAGGEILERYRLSRSRYSYHDFMAACRKVTPRGMRHGVVPG